MATPIPSNRADFSLEEIALATHGTVTHRGLYSHERATGGVTTDSRAVVAKSVFVALRGDKHDGHDWIVSAIKSGARVVVVEKRRASDVVSLTGGGPIDASVVEVEDTLVAWGDIARAHLTRWRNDSLDGRVVAITGSAGKTTTKELTAALLNEVAPTHFTAGNLNNRIGVPAVVMALDSQVHRFCVLEMGMSLPGELDAITAIAKPDVAVIVNIGIAHSEGVGGGLDGVTHEKGAVYRALDPKGIAIINVDDPCVRRAARASRIRKFETFGRGSGPVRRPGSFAEDSMPDVNAATTITGPPSRSSSNSTLPPSSDRLLGAPHYRLVDRIPERSGSRVVLSCAGRELAVYLPIPGEAAAIDLVAALATQEAVSRELLSAAQIEHALATVAARLHGRGSIRILKDDIVVIDDTYNANPASMRAALATLGELAVTNRATPRRRVAILGEMKELGDLAEAEHDALGAAIAKAEVALVIGCGGSLMKRALERAANGGVEITIAATSTDDAAAATVKHVQRGDAVLVKGSRSVGTEKIVAALVAKSPEVLPSSTESASPKRA